MLLDVTCKQGKLQVLEEGVIRVLAPFNRVVWQMPCASVTSFSTQSGAMMTVAIAIQSTQGVQYVEMVTQQNFQKLQALFPHLATNAIQGHEWYHDLKALTHIVTYTNQKQMQKEMEAASHFGWMPQNTAAQNGKFSVGKAIVGGAVLGPVGLLAGAVGNKDKITITFVRTPQWIEKNT